MQEMCVDREWVDSSFKLRKVYGRIKLVIFLAVCLFVALLDIGVLFLWRGQDQVALVSAVLSSLGMLMLLMEVLTDASRGCRVDQWMLFTLGLFFFVSLLVFVPTLSMLVYIANALIWSTFTGIAFRSFKVVWMNPAD